MNYTAYFKIGLENDLKPIMHPLLINKQNMVYFGIN